MRARLSLVAALAALLVYWLGWSGLPHAVDELSALSVTESIAASGQFHTTQMEWDQARTPPQNSRAADGLLYSKKGIGVSLAALPLWALGSWLPASPLALSFLAGSLLGALATGAMVWAALGLGYGRATALIAGGALALGTLHWPYARTLFSEAIAGPGLALALAGAICAAYSVLREPRNLTPQPPLHVERGSTATAFACLPLSESERGPKGEVRLSPPLQMERGPRGEVRLSPPLQMERGPGGEVPRSTQHGVRHQSPITNHQSPALLCGIGLALLILAKSSNAVIAPLFLVYLLVAGEGARGVRVRRALWAMIPAGAAVAVTVAYNYARFGTLLGFPLEPFERFSTPLGVGLAGLLVSPGKGLLWFVPLAWLTMAGAVVALRGRARLRPADVLLALGCVVAPLLLYALWYDWPGGRAWGPRMVAWTMPALVLLALPLLDALPDRSRPRSLRLGVGIMLGLSVLAQLPGVLWNFETVEARAMAAGASFEALIWEAAHSPLLTTWGAARTLTPEPLLLQPALWAEPLRALLPLALIAASAACLLWGARRAELERGRAPLIVAALLALLAGGALAAAARLDPRRLDPTANPADNAALVAFVDAHAAPDDLLLFDLRDDRDPQARAWWRLDALPAPPPFAGLLRTPVPDGDLLQRLTAGQPRVWLAMVETAEGDPAATIEAWLDAHGWRGASTWLGAQRVVEYSMESAGAPALPIVASDTPIDFGPLALEGYTVEQGPRPGDWRVALRWSRPAPELRFSLQALDAAGALAAQIDRAPAADVDRVLLAAPTAAPNAARLILKLYDPATGAPLGPEFVPLTPPL